MNLTIGKVGYGIGSRALKKLVKLVQRGDAAARTKLQYEISKTGFDLSVDQIVKKVASSDHRKIWQRPFTKTTFQDFSSIPEKMRQTLCEEAQKDIPQGLTAQIRKYAQCVLDGIKSFQRHKKVQVISIGQSPAVITETLSLKGIPTAICPISALKQMGKDAPLVMGSSPKFKQYIENLKGYGFDISALRKDTDYIFLDYTASGKSLENFRTMLREYLSKGEQKGFSGVFVGENMQFLSMNKEVVPKALKKAKGVSSSFIEKFEETQLHDKGLKTLFSPVYRLPYSNLEQLKGVEDLPRNELFTKLKFLLFCGK